MNNKYYTPEMWEFREGFRYEYKSKGFLGILGMHKDWHREKFSGGGGSDGEAERYDIYNLINGNHDGEVRVKKLDQADIEELGWELIEQSICQFTGKKNQFIIHKPILLNVMDDYSYTYVLTIVRDKINIKEIAQGGFDGITLKEQLFFGVIKNYNELEVLMNQIGISK